MLPTAALAAAALAFWAPGHERQACPAGLHIDTVPTVTAAMVDWDPDAGVEDATRVLAFAPMLRGECQITVNLSLWRELTDVERCEVIVHEAGHSVMGLDHVRDPTNIMAATLVDRFPYCDAVVARYPLNALRAKVRRYEAAHRRHLKRSIGRRPARRHRHRHRIVL